MAGTFTHWMIVEEALDKFEKLPEKHDYFARILSHNHFVTLGAAGPDYPYLHEIIQGFFKVHSWADRMHYENIDDFVIYAIQNLLDAPEPDFSPGLAWLCGLVTHLIADTVIHPVVNAIVGPYLFNSEEHRHCEMTQDSYIFHYITGNEIRYAAPGDDGYLGLLKMCSDPGDEDRIHPAIRDLWGSTLRMSHPAGQEYFDKIEPDRWHQSFLSKIGFSADPISIFRHMGEQKSVVYKKTGEFTPEETEKFIGAIKLPGGGVGNFKEDAFDKAVSQVIDIWGRLFADIAANQPENCRSYIKDWNLDIGVDADDGYFWR